MNGVRVETIHSGITAPEREVFVGEWWCSSRLSGSSLKFWPCKRVMQMMWMMTLITFWCRLWWSLLLIFATLIFDICLTRTHDSTIPWSRSSYKIIALWSVLRFCLELIDNVLISRQAYCEFSSLAVVITKFNRPCSRILLYNPVLVTRCPVLQS